MINWKDLKVRNKLLICYALPLLLLTVVAMWIFFESSGALRSMEKVKNETVELALLAERMGKDVVQIQQWLTDAT